METKTAVKVIEPLIYDIGAPGRNVSTLLPKCDLPEVSEIDAVRHFVRLSHLNHGIDTGFYPLGSCTMKYNPKIDEDTARIPGFAGMHPFQPAATAQGTLRLLWELQ